MADRKDIQSGLAIAPEAMGDDFYSKLVRGLESLRTAVDPTPTGRSVIETALTLVPATRGFVPGNRGYFNAFNANGDRVFGAYVNPINPKHLSVNIEQVFDRASGTNKLGNKEMLSVIPQIKKFYPEAETISGGRISGTRGKIKQEKEEKSEKFDPTQIVSLRPRGQRQSLEEMRKQIAEAENQRLVELTRRRPEMASAQRRIREQTEQFEREARRSYVLDVLKSLGRGAAGIAGGTFGSGSTLLFPGNPIGLTNQLTTPQMNRNYAEFLAPIIRGYERSTKTIPPRGSVP